VDLPTPYRLAAGAPVFSPDGRSLVIPATRSNVRVLFLLRLADGRPTLIPGTVEARAPAFSPDGRWLAFVAAGKLMKVALDGGTPIALTEADGLGVAWADDQTIIFNRKYNTGLWRISASGGRADTLTSPRTSNGELGHWWPQVLPGRHPIVLFTAYGGAMEQARISAVSLETGKRTDVLEGGIYGRYLPAGRLLYYRSGNVFSVPFDADRLKVTGAPLPILQRVALDRLTVVPFFAVSEMGHMAWVPDSQYLAPRQLVWLDEKGAETPAYSQTGSYRYPRLSPDGRRVALTVYDETPDIMVLDLATGVRTRLTRNPVIEQRPLWAPDGRRVVYQAENGAFDIYSRAADASDTAVLLYSTRYDKYPYSMTPDGRQLTVMEDSLNERLLIVTLGDSARARGYAAGPYNQEAPMLSPDGRWLAFASDESGRYQIYVAPFDSGSAAPRPLAPGGIASSSDYVWIRWSPSGRELFYATTDSLMRVPFDPRTGTPGVPRLVLRGEDEFADVAPDGRRFLIVKTPAETAPRRVELVLNWLQELEDKAGK
jgi:serine/threonine-protein kinase